MGSIAIHIGAEWNQGKVNCRTIEFSKEP